MFHVKHEGWSDPRPLGVAVDAEQRELLVRFEGLIRERAVPLGMIARSDLPRLWERHVLDGLRGAPLLPATVRLAYDLGSGAGIPGIPISIARPEITVVLVEVRRARVAFLELAIEKLGLSNATVHAGRATELDSLADACMARAFGSASASWRLARSLLAPSGILLYWAGPKWRAPELPGVRSMAFSAPGLANAGPVVMMSRQ